MVNLRCLILDPSRCGESYHVQTLSFPTTIYLIEVPGVVAIESIQKLVSVYEDHHCSLWRFSLPVIWAVVLALQSKGTAYYSERGKCCFCGCYRLLVASFKAAST